MTNKQLHSLIGFVIALIFISIVFSSCLSTKQRARNKIAKGYNLIQKGLDLYPELADSVNKVNTITVTIPGKIDSIFIKPEIDTLVFQATLDNYDSIKSQLDSLDILLASGNYIDKELAFRKLWELNKSLNETKARLSTGFSKDSTYVFEDNIAKFSLSLKNGLLHKFEYDIKPQRKDTTVATNEIKLDGRKVVGDFWEDQKFWLFLIILIVLIILVSIKIRR